MLHIIGTEKELGKLNDLPEELITEVSGILKILDEAYGADRDILEDDGGWVCIIENNQDVQELKETYEIDLEELAPEFCTKLSDKWLNIFVLCNNEFGIQIMLSTQTDVSENFMTTDSTLIM